MLNEKTIIDNIEIEIDHHEMFGFVESSTLEFVKLKKEDVIFDGEACRILIFKEQEN